MLRFALAFVLVMSALTATATGDDIHAVLFKDPSCGCCGQYAFYLRQNGFAVKVVNTEDLTAVKREHGVPEKLEGCHSTMVSGYVVEGHVPVATLRKLLVERPRIRGISLPGMPQGSPGMTGEKEAPFTIHEIADGADKVYAVE